MSRGGSINPGAGPSVPRRAYLSRGGPICPEAGLSTPTRAHLSRGGPIYPEAGLSIGGLEAEDAVTVERRS